MESHFQVMSWFQCNFRHIMRSRSSTYSEDEADGGHARRGHDFGTVGDQVEENGHDGLCGVVEATAEHQRQVAGDSRETGG